MGLDMYAYARRPEACIGDRGVREPMSRHDISETSQGGRFFSWRKHPNLHGWMGRLWRSKYPGLLSLEDFNGIAVEITLEDLDALERCVRKDLLPVTAGFFFGESNGGAEEREKDLQFIGKARKLITEGWVVFYDSSW